MILKKNGKMEVTASSRRRQKKSRNELGIGFLNSESRVSGDKSALVDFAKPW